MVFPYWECKVKPFRVIGNLYFVGSYEGSSHMLDTEDGLVIIDTGYPQTLYRLLENVRAWALIHMQSGILSILMGTMTIVVERGLWRN